VSLHRRLKDESSDWKGAVPEGHHFRATPLSSNSLGQFSKAEMEELLVAVSDGFTHIVIPANRDWAEITSAVRFDCRTHIARLREPIWDLTWEILKAALHEIAEMDEIWMDKISPKDLRHALLLPPPFFATTVRVSHYWQHCDVYSRDRLSSAERLLSQVEEDHRKPDGKGIRCWLDAKNRRFRSDHSQHGLSAADRARRKAFRFCYEVSPGFHYDVTEDSGKSFKVEMGGRSQMVQHINVTPWGRLR
jgi:hypothetical protein